MGTLELAFEACLLGFAKIQLPIGCTETYKGKILQPEDLSWKGKNIFFPIGFQIPLVIYRGNRISKEIEFSRDVLEFITLN